jgi:predicted  nucleic acid-binding Zn-ribbon protein
MGFHNLRIVGVAALVLAAVGVSAVAQSARPQEPDVRPALLVEVRGLRHAMEQLASAGPRVQLALGRLQLQEQRVNTIVRRLESIREAVADAERSAAQHQAEIAQMEESLKTAETHPDRDQIVRAVTQEVREVKRRLAMTSRDLERLQSEEASLQQQIANEQARWSDINRSLEELEGALGRR